MTYTPYEEDLNNQGMNDEIDSLLSTVENETPPDLEEETPTATQPQAQPEQPEAPAQEEEPGLLQSVGEVAASVPVGVADFAVDFVNGEIDKTKTIWNIDSDFNVPKVPKFDNELAEGVRAFSSYIGPIVGLTRGSKVGVKGLATKAGSNLPSKMSGLANWVNKDKLVQWVTPRVRDAGIGAYVDLTNKRSETDHNLTGYLKSEFPDTWGWIPDDLATMEGDSPEMFRQKTMREGVGLGFMVNIVEAGVAFGRSARNLVNNLYIPKDDTAVAALTQKGLPTAADTAKSADEIAAETLAKGPRSREEALDELGKYFLEVEEDITKPLKGVTDDLDWTENGILSKGEGGITGAMVDNAKIVTNQGTVWGRMRSIATDAAIKKGIAPESLQSQDLAKAVVKEIQASGKFDYKGQGYYLTQEQISKSGDLIADVVFDPRSEPGFIKKVLDEFKYVDEAGVNVLNTPAYDGVVKALKKYQDDYINMDLMRAKGYINTAMAGEVSGIAEGARLMDGTAAIEGAREMIRDRLKYLYVEKGLASYTRASGLANLNVWDRLKNVTKSPEELQKAILEAQAREGDALSRAILRAENYNTTLQQLARDGRNDLLGPFHLALELTDGHVDTIGKLNNWYAETLANLGKGLYDPNPEIQNLIVKGLFSNLYNSTLSAFDTGLSALAGTTVLLLEKPFTIRAGAFLAGDKAIQKRAAFMFADNFRTMGKALKFGGSVFAKGVKTGESATGVFDDVIKRRNDAQFEAARAMAEANFAKDPENWGGLALVQQAEDLDALSRHPATRLIPSMMGGLDGFGRSVQANIEAGGRAYDEIMENGQEMSQDLYRAIRKRHYDSMFDANGKLKDKAVDFASREVALMVDNPVADSFNEMAKTMPILKTVFMFPRTATNAVARYAERSVFAGFGKDVRALAKPNALKTMTKVEMERIMDARGIVKSEQTLSKLKEIQAEVRGRIAMGTLFTTYAALAWTMDMGSSSGVYDYAQQRTRRELGQKPKSHRIPFTDRYLDISKGGPMAEWMVTVWDVMDNFDRITESSMENAMQKLSFIFAANLTEKSMFGALEPLADMMGGNPNAINRWTSTFANNLAPFGGFRSEVSRKFFQGLREFDEDFGSLLRNRNNWLDGIDPQGALPVKTDWLYGTPVGVETNPWIRGWNAMSPFKVSTTVNTPERDWLSDIEFDGRAIVNNSKMFGGVELLPRERAFILEQVGKQGYFLKEVQRIMRSPDGKNFVKDLKEFRRNGEGSDVKSIDLFNNIHNQLDLALTDAIKLAERQMKSDLPQSYERLQSEEYKIQQNDYRSQRGEPALLNNY